MTLHSDQYEENHGPPPTAYQVWEGMWVALKERQDQADLRLSDDLQEFIDQTKQLVTLAEQEKLDPSPLVLFLDGTERYYHGVGTGIPKLTSALRTLLRRLELRLEEATPAAAPPSPLEEATPAAAPPSPAVILASKTKQPIVRGTPKPVLRQAQYNVVKALVDAGESGLTVDQLVAQSGHADARGILRRLADSDPDWRSVIHFPGKAGGHYRIG
jgi:hypothetical protein